MAYQQRPSGGFRMRASFPVSSELVQLANRACEIQKVSMAELCKQALSAYASVVIHRAEKAQETPQA